LTTQKLPGHTVPDAGPADLASLFTAAYRTYSASVRGYLRARGVDDPDAATHDVFLALYTRMTPPEGDAGPGTPPRVTGGLEGAKALAFTIAHGRAVDHHRRRSRTPLLVAHEQDEDPRPSPPTPEDEVLAASGVLRLLGDLSDDHREVLLLRVVADLSIEQTAEIMGRTTGAVKQLQRRALDALRATAKTAELSTR
jgi:RNA polymerase sigma-70 factor (ECF subfamily)